ncbi:MAG: DUF763 domain-containing protein [Candidatus Omnitrophica bacterium]|nr:DUF763 domain-containing protein [Candidatus Omnitrophota bacterium]
MIHRGVATFTLDSGKCPKWLFERMVRLGRQVVRVIVSEYGPDELVERLADPVWFQSLGTVLAFDWNASGLTTTLTAALKEAIRRDERYLGVFICGGKGKTSRKTPDQIQEWGNVLSLPAVKVNNLVYNSRMAAKVDSALIQDGFQIYHHCFIFSRNGAWAVVQQGMNTENLTARRYHWFSRKITDLVCEPHSGIISQVRVPTLDLTSKESTQTREVSTQLVQNGYTNLIKEIKLLNKYSTGVSQMVTAEAGGEKITMLNLENKEFHSHPVQREDFSKSKYLERVLNKVCDIKPQSYEELLSQEGVGPKTMRAIGLVAEVVYGAKPSYEDPARYSFAHGGKDGTPYEVDRQTYDTTIQYFTRLVNKMKISPIERKSILTKLSG